MKRNTKTSAGNGLAGRTCKSCESGEGKLQKAEVASLLKKLHGGWKLNDKRQLEKCFEFPDFKEALAFTDQVGAIAEEQGHHPDIFLAWGKVRIQISTHSAGGLTENDFILAAKINEV